MSYEHEAKPVGTPEHNRALFAEIRRRLGREEPPRLIAEELGDAIPIQGHVSPRQRVEEALLIIDYWPRDDLDLALRRAADWSALLEPARWIKNGEADAQEVWAFAQEMVIRLGRWPRADEMRRRFGKTAGHRLPGESDDQEAMPV